MAIMAGPMMQALLEDRFQLKVHREKRDSAVYELTVAKAVPKFNRQRPAVVSQPIWPI